MKRICDCNIVELPYVFEFGRYNEALYNVIIRLKATGKISKKMKDKKLKDFSMINICRCHKTREAVNERMLNEYIKMNPNLTVYIWKDMKFIKGMPLICNINNRDFNIWNSQKFTVVNIVGNIITLKNNSND